MSVSAGACSGGRSSYGNGDPGVLWEGLGGDGGGGRRGTIVT